MQEGTRVRKRRGRLQAPNFSLAPGSANVRGGPATRLLGDGVLSAEGSLPEEGDDTHGPEGKGEWMGKRTAQLPTEVSSPLATTDLLRKGPPCEHCRGQMGTGLPPWGRTLNPEIPTCLEDLRVMAGPA